MRKNIVSKLSFVGLITGLSLAMAMGISLSTNAQPQETIPTNAQPQETNRNAKAEELLLEMTSYIKDAQSFTFDADLTQDAIGKYGQHIERGATAEFTIQRPNRIRADYDGDFRDVSFYYDGTQFTMLEANKNVYGVIPLSSDIDGLVDVIEEDYGFVLPMGSFISTDLYSRINDQIITSDYLGLAKIRGLSCHHLAFTLEKIDLQLWVAEGEKPLPCKFVVTYKQETGVPEYTAILSDWNFSECTLNDSHFTVELPPDVYEIPILPNPLRKE